MYQKERKVTIGKEMENHHYRQRESNPKQHVGSVRDEILLEVATCRSTRSFLQMTQLTLYLLHHSPESTKRKEESAINKKMTLCRSSRNDPRFCNKQSTN